MCQVEVSMIICEGIFVKAAERLAYDVIDMHPLFIKKNRQDGSVFEFESDGHWNQSGHKLVASEIVKSQVYQATIGVAE